MGPVTTPGCGTHAGLGTELRAVAALLLDRVGPVLERARTGVPQSPQTCASCPVCAVVAVMRGEHPELAKRLAEHASGLLDALQSALDQPAEPPRSPAPTRRVQRVHVERQAAARC